MTALNCSEGIEGLFLNQFLVDFKLFLLIDFVRIALNFHVFLLFFQNNIKRSIIEYGTVSHQEQRRVRAFISQEC